MPRVGIISCMAPRCPRKNNGEQKTTLAGFDANKGFATARDGQRLVLTSLTAEDEMT